MQQILTPDDLKKGDLVPAAWYPVEIVDYEESAASESAKNPGSTNCIFYFKVLEGHPYSGVQFKRLFNETALGFGKTLWPVLGFPFDAVKGYVLTTEMFESVAASKNGGSGFKLQVYVKRGRSNQGNEFNDVTDFKPLAA